MSSADLLEDGFPHGTRAGWDRGCRGAGCPSLLEHGLSCRRAKELDAGDYQYRKLAAAGRTPADIAVQLGLHPEIHRPPVKRVVADVDDEDVQVVDLDEETDGEESDMSIIDQEVVPTPATIVHGKKPDQPAAVPPWPDEPSESSDTSDQAPDDSPAAIRAWARENGIEVNSRGAVRTDVVSAWKVAHGIVGSERDVTKADVEFPGKNEVGLYTGPGAESYEGHADLTGVVIHAEVVPDRETRIGLINEGFEEAERQFAIAATMSTLDALEFALQRWAAESDRRIDLEQKCHELELRVARADARLAHERSVPWWRRIGRG